jgi:peptide/nickel transport system permease protein
MTSPAIATSAIEAPDLVAARPGVLKRLLRNPSVLIGGVMIVLIALIGAIAPLLTPIDPAAIDPSNRNKLPGHQTTARDDDGNKHTRTAVMGTDSLGRDIFARVVYGARVSLTVGLAVALLSVGIGLAVGLAAGYFRALDGVIMRVMDGLMAVPAILVAIALVSLSGASLLTVIVAVTIPEIPRVVRLVRAIVLSIREEPYVEAAISVGTPTIKVLWRHVLPNTIAPLIVQATFIAGAAILLEAALSFLGVGIPPETPTWGNIMAEGRSVFQILPHNILYPAAFLTATVLAINMLGDGLRDTLDPRMAKRV